MTTQTITVTKADANWGTADEAVAAVVAGSVVNMKSLLEPFAADFRVSTLFELNGTNSVRFIRVWEEGAWEEFSAAHAEEIQAHHASLEGNGFTVTVA